MILHFGTKEVVAGEEYAGSIGIYFINIEKIKDKVESAEFELTK